MWSSRARLVLIGWALLVQAGCQPVLSTLPAAPTPVIWRVNITPALRWFGPLFQKCAAENPGVGLVLQERSAASPETGVVDFSFQWGERLPAAPYTALVANEELAVIVHPGNPNNTLTAAALLGLFGAQSDLWKEACPTCAAGFDGLLQTYGYAAGEDVQAAAGWIQPGPRTRLAPDPEAVRQAVAKDPYALGFVPAHWVDGTVKRVKLEGAVPGPLQQPILVSAPAEPQGSQRSWLVCVQDQVR